MTSHWIGKNTYVYSGQSMQVAESPKNWPTGQVAPAAATKPKLRKLVA